MLSIKRYQKDAYVIKYGAIGDDFYITIKGSVSVWLPVEPAEIIKPLQKFKRRVKSAILSSVQSEKINFQFYLDPFKIEE